MSRWSDPFPASRFGEPASFVLSFALTFVQLSAIVFPLVVVTPTLYGQSARRPWWQRATVVSSRSYRIRSDLDRAALRPIANHFDRTFAEFGRRLSDLPARGPEGLDLLIFGERDDYEFTFLHQWGVDARNTGGMYFHLADARGLALWTEGRSRRSLESLIQHEGFHQFAASRFGSDLPPWAEEGLAELFGAAVFIGGDLNVGETTPRMIEPIQNAIETGDTVPFSVMLTLDAEMWRERLSGEKAAIHYRQAWSMVHCLVYGQGGALRPSFERYLRLVNIAVPPAEAYRRVFGEHDGPFEEAWRAHVLAMRPSPHATTIERVEFLAAGARELAQSDIYPMTLETLRDALVAADFRYSIEDAELGVAEVSATDPAQYVVPSDAPPGSRADPPVIVLEEPGFSLDAPRDRAGAIRPRPAIISTRHLRPFDIEVEWTIIGDDPVPYPRVRARR